ncbi:MAG: hypothetical protein WBX25_05635 [Rhodomicrobium sp.]
MSGLRRVLALIAGVALPFGVLMALAPPWRVELDGWDNYYLSTYPADFAVRPKHLIIGTACWTWTPEAYMPIGSDIAVTTQRAALHSALNTMTEGEGDERFYGFGTPEVDFERHLMSIRVAVEQGDVRSIIYINNPGSLQAFTKPRNAVRVLPVLDAIEHDYPELASDVKTYREALLASAGYRKGVEQISGTLWLTRVSERMSTWMLGVSRRFRGILDGMSFMPFEARRKIENTGALFEEVKKNYDNPVTCSAPERGLLPKDLYWAGSGGEAVWQSWLRIAAGMAAKHGIAFVYYVPPHLNVPAKRYEAEFRPAFVDKVSAVLAPFSNAAVIDHAVGHGLSACDQVYDSQLHFSAGYLFNFVGKLKQSRLLLSDLAKRRIVSASAETFSSPSRWERELPAVWKEPSILSAEESERVREDLYSSDDWKLSLPFNSRVAVLPGNQE